MFTEVTDRRMRCSRRRRSVSPMCCRGLEAMTSEMQRELDDDAQRAAQGHSRTAAGDRRQRRPDAPRHRRPDRGAGRAQSHRRPPWPRDRRRRAGPASGRGGGGGRSARRASDARGAADRQWRPAARAAPRARRHHRHERRPVIPARRAEAPALSPAQAGGGARTGWLSDLLTRASQEAEPGTLPAPPREPRARKPRDARACARRRRRTGSATPSIRSTRSRSISPA